MGFPTRLLAALASVAILVSSADAVDPAGPPRAPSIGSDGGARVIVRLRVAWSPEAELGTPERVSSQQSAIAEAQAALVGRLAGTGATVVRSFRTAPFLAVEATPAALAVLAGAPEVEEVMEDPVERLFLIESQLLTQSHQAHALGVNGLGQAVAVIDSGVDKNHPFLAGRVIEEACFSARANCPNGGTSMAGPGAAVPCGFSSDCDHGTHVAGIVAGSALEATGVAPAAGILAIQVSSAVSCSTGTCLGIFGSDTMAALDYVYQRRLAYPIASVNMSLGGGASSTYCDSDPRKPFIDNLRAAGIATIIASGNAGYINAISAPACISTAVSVGSTNESDQVSFFSNSASFLTMLAPGETITSSVPGGGYEGKGGTSMAAPQVAGAWALLKHAKPSAGVTEALDAVLATGKPVTDPFNGVTKPRLRAVNAVLRLAPPPFSANRYSGDFNGDGKADIVWRETTGALFIWPMNGTGIVGATYLTPISLAWQIQGTGDFNGDGRDDILWREVNTGSVFIWLMNGPTLIGGTGFTSIQPDNTWQIKGVGDFNGDGRTDILWRHVGGALYIWPMNGTDIVGPTYLDPIPLAWQPQAVADFNGDGRADILWREANFAGQTYLWLMNGAALMAAGYTASFADQTWQVHGVGDLN
ncbi:MAG TPA: S8 family serine peptidase, partial [Nonomuraea sp.]|nr:S8 family serine peptidase [Nonomuraea sp.]